MDTSDNLPIPTSTDPEQNMQLASGMAAVHVPYAVDILGDRLRDPNITVKNALDIGEFMYKVSGMSKKHEVKDDAATVTVNINLGGGKSLHFEEKVVGDTLDAETITHLTEEATNLLAGGEIPEEAWQ